jgi:hypothetical protein
MGLCSDDASTEAKERVKQDEDGVAEMQGDEDDFRGRRLGGGG